ncbi:O-antigen ligase family protein [Niallia sp. 03091]|uniref:O-antigen ligase family protein n=1 Tax=Niallia sp. 03091 TaxID=3458059 RepID=UPI004044EF7A
MKIENHRKQFEISLIVLGFIAATLIKYPITHFAYSLFLGLFSSMLIIRYTQIGLHLKKINIYFLFFLIVSLVYTVISSIDNRMFFIRNYLLMYMLIFYMYIMFTKYGTQYAAKTYRQLTILLNILSVMNLYQVFFKKPLLLNYMNIREVGYNYHIGTDLYRTMSVFDHPIVCGLFFVIAFLSNIYILKTPLYKYSLQFILLINIYSTMSRSAWIALVISLIFYGTIHYKRIFKLPKQIILTYKKMIIMYIASIFTIIGVIYLIFNYYELYNAIANRFGDSLSFNSSDNSSLQRTMTISLILEYMQQSNYINYLFGYGSGQVSKFMLAHPITMQNFSTTDNQYLAWFYELGIIGLVSYLITIFFIFTHILIKKRNWVNELSLLCLLVISVELFFFELYEWQNVSLMLAFVISCLTVKKESSTNNSNIVEKKGYFKKVS